MDTKRVVAGFRRISEFPLRFWWWVASHIQLWHQFIVKLAHVCHLRRPLDCNFLVLCKIVVRCTRSFIISLNLGFNATRSSLHSRRGASDSLLFSIYYHKQKSLDFFADLWLKITYFEWFMSRVNQVLHLMSSSVYLVPYSKHSYSNCLYWRCYFEQSVLSCLVFISEPLQKSGPCSHWPDWCQFVAIVEIAHFVSGSRAHLNRSGALTVRQL